MSGNCLVKSVREDWENSKVVSWSKKRQDEKLQQRPQRTDLDCCQDPCSHVLNLARRLENWF